MCFSKNCFRLCMDLKKRKKRLLSSQRDLERKGICIFFIIFFASLFLSHWSFYITRSKAFCLFMYLIIFIFPYFVHFINSSEYFFVYLFLFFFSFFISYFIHPLVRIILYYDIINHFYSFSFFLSLFQFQLFHLLVDTQ